RYSCSPQHTDSALYPIIGQMERAAGLAREDSSRAKLDKLDQLLKQTSTSAQDAALFAEMLSLPNDGRYPAVKLTPQQCRQRTLEAVALHVEALARSCPALMFFEDAHCSHPLLATVVRKPEAELQTTLDRLISAGLLLRQSGAPYPTYSFKHALVRDAAYSTLLREPRRALHARIAETLESQFAEIAENQPELIARHYREADDVAKAVGYLS